MVKPLGDEKLLCGRCRGFGSGDYLHIHLVLFIGTYLETGSLWVINPRYGRVGAHCKGN